MCYMSEWRIVPGFERFSVTRDGRVRRNAMDIFRLGAHGKKQVFKFVQRDCSPCVVESGYERVSVSTGRKRFPAYVHRLVALAWVPGYEPGCHVNHIDGKKVHNHADNLEWMPNEENVKHQWRTGLVDLRGERASSAKLNWSRVEAIRRALRKGVKANTIAIISGMSVTAINKIRDGVTWRSIYG